MDNRFLFLKEFKIVVPGEYNHNKQLLLFSGRNWKEFRNFSVAITDENFSKATQKLVPGRTYAVKFFQITSYMSSEDCLAFLETQKAILVGAQGLSLAWELKREEFVAGKLTVSFDIKDALWVDDAGDHRVPLIHCSSAVVQKFILGSFERGWCIDHCLLCVCGL